MYAASLLLGMFISVISPNQQPTLVKRLLTVNRQDYLNWNLKLELERISVCDPLKIL